MMMMKVYLFIVLLSVPVIHTQAGTLVNEESSFPIDSTLSNRQITQTKPCKRLLWFTVLGGLGGHVHQHKRSIRAAVASARAYAPSLVPNIVIHTEDVRDYKFLKWFRGIGGYVHDWNLTFFQDIHDAVHVHNWQSPGWLTQYGTYMKIDISKVMYQNVVGKWDPEAFELSYVLCTDADVLFRNDVNSCTAPPWPEVMSMGGDLINPHLPANSGVMFINVSALEENHAGIINRGKALRWGGNYEQTLLQDYFTGRLSHLPAEYNWYPVWGINNDAIVVHFFGPKPENCLACVTMSLLQHNRSRDAPYGQCNCPPVYLEIFNNGYDKDKGDAYVLEVLRFYHFLLASLRSQE